MNKPERYALADSHNRDNDILREQIAAQTKAFLASGGVVQKIADGVGTMLIQGVSQSGKNAGKRNGIVINPQRKIRQESFE